MDIKNILILVLSVLLLFAGCEIKKRGKIKTETKTEYIETVIYDTVRLEAKSVPIPTPIETIKYKTVLVEVANDPDTIEVIKYVNAKIPIRIYSDSINLDENVKLHYSHEVAGTLEDSNYKLDYINQTKIKETTITKTKEKPKLIEVFGVGGYNLTNTTFQVGGDLSIKRLRLGYRHGSDRSHTIELGFKLFEL
jgi:hypothetical protein